jgi:hypothetical protein
LTVFAIFLHGFTVFGILAVTVLSILFSGMAVLPTFFDGMTVFKKLTVTVFS